MSLVPPLSDDAQADFQTIVRQSNERFGAQAARRYLRLLQTAIMKVGCEPQTLLSKPYESAHQSVRFYHIRHSREEAAIDGVTVQNPRHFIVYTQNTEGVVRIFRILHDRMEFSRHL